MAELLVQMPLPGVGCPGDLRGAGGAGFRRVDLHRGPPHLDGRQQVFVGVVQADPRPGRVVGAFPGGGSHLVGELGDPLGLLVQPRSEGWIVGERGWNTGQPR